MNIELLQNTYECLKRPEDTVKLQMRINEALSSSINKRKEYIFEGTDKFVGFCCGNKVDNIAQEPWPQQIKLYQPFEVEQILLPDNANCLAVQAFLHMCNLDYTIEPRKNAEFMSPSGRVPFIQCGAFVISDFDNIVTFIGNKGSSLSTDLTSEEKADMRAYMSLVNNGLANAEQYICWVDPMMVEAVTKKRHGSVYPWPLNHILNWQKQRQVTKKLKVLGLCNKTTEEVLQDVKMCCTALSDRLDGKQYFYGNQGPKELDALVFGHLFTILTTPLPGNKLAEIVKNYPDLVDLCQRIEKRYFGRKDE